MNKMKGWEDIPYKRNQNKATVTTRTSVEKSKTVTRDKESYCMIQGQFIRRIHSTGRAHAEAEAPTLWPPDAKNLLTGKDPDVGKD